MSKLLEFFNDMRDNGYGLAEIAAQLGTSAIAEPVAGFAAMYDPVHGADAIREGMTYQPRSEAAKMYQQGASNVVGQAVKPVIPVIDAWQQGVDIAGKYSPSFGAILKTVPTAIGVALGAKPAMQQGRQLSNSLGSMQARMVANANAPRTLNTGFMRQRGSVGTQMQSIKQISDNWEKQGIKNNVSENGKRVMLSLVVVPKELRNQGIGTKYMQELIDYADSVGKRVELTPSSDFGGNKNKLKEFYSRFGFVENKGRNKDFEISETMYRQPKPSGFMGQRGSVGTQRPLTEFEQAHATAQRNAALPVEKGGLGLPADNTAMDRARALGFDVDTTYTHRSRTPNYIQEINPKGEYSGLFSLANDDAGVNYGNNKHEFLLKGDIATNIADEYSDALLKKNLKEIVGHKSSTKISSNDMDTIRYALDNQTMFMNEPDRLYELFNSFDDVDSFVAIQKTLGELSRKKGYGAVKMEDEFGDSTMLLHGNKVRYKDAAFDPKKAKSSNLLAKTAPLVPTTALGAYMYNENRKKSQGNQ